MSPPIAEDSAVTIDANSIEAFVNVVFGGVTGFVDVRLLAEKGTPDQPPRCFSLPVDRQLTPALVHYAKEAADIGAACHVVPAGTPRRGRARVGTVAQVAVIVVDLDDGDIEMKRAHLEAYIGAPTLTVASGGKTSAGQSKLHLYWRLQTAADGDDLERVRLVRERIARKVGADISVARLQQPIRLAGSIHCKHGLRAPVPVLGHSEAAWSLKALEMAADALPSIAPLEHDPGSRAGGQEGATRFDALSQYIGKQVRDVRLGRATRAAAWEAIKAFNATRVEPGWDERRLRQEFEALELLDRRNHGKRRIRKNDDLDLTEHGLARRLVDEHGAGWRYVPAQGAWLEWTGSHWRPDETRRVLELCRQHCEAAALDEAPGGVRRILSERTIRAVERLAQCDPRISAAVGEWDRHEMLLNTPAGVLDLATGELLQSDPGLQLTRITQASPGTGCPRWLKFVGRITGGDGELASYLQRVAGYCLTGRTDEQAFFLLHGPGANGKTVFLEVLAHVLGGYARSAALDTFMAARGERQSFDLAGLDGVRLLIATETEAGRAWAEARIKAITGGDRIAVRHLYQSFYETTASYKLLISGNHRPRISGGGKAMLRRLQMIPFDTVIPEGERDGRLREKLVQEQDGILGWMLDGCRAWQDSGLRVPQRVRDAVTSYFDNEDVVGQWIAECCDQGGHLRSSAGELFASWRARADAIGVPAGSARDLGERLRDHGFEPFRNRQARGWIGLAPRAAGAGSAQQ